MQEQGVPLQAPVMERIVTANEVPQSLNTFRPHICARSR